jgi:hypothetical protein
MKATPSWLRIDKLDETFIFGNGDREIQTLERAENHKVLITKRASSSP